MYQENFEPTEEAGSHDAQYFDSYADLEVHRVMLSDQPRMEFYSKAIDDTVRALKKAQDGPVVVVDVGAGTGVLSMYAARAGADKVLAIEASALGATLLTTLASDNGFPQEQLSVVNERVEDLISGVSAGANGATEDETEESGEEAAIESFINKAGLRELSAGVSIIVSEWMGFYLLHECMLPSVLRMRDFIAKVNAKLGYTVPALPSLGAVNDTRGPSEAFLIPDRASIRAAPVQLGSYYTQHFAQPWSRIPCATPGAKPLSLNRLGHAAFETALVQANPFVAQLPPDAFTAIGASPTTVAEYDLYSTTIEETLAVAGEVPLHLAPQASGVLREEDDDALANKNIVSGLSVWFDVTAPSSSFGGSSGMLILDTSPAAAPTHWKQATVLLPREMVSDMEMRIDCRNHAERAAVDEAPSAMVIGLACEEEDTRCYALELSLA